MKTSQFRAMMLVLLMAVVSLGMVNAQAITVSGTVTYFLPWAILVGVVWIVALITFSWISFRKCELK